LTDEDAVPEVQPLPVAKLGDLFIRGNHHLVCGDCTQPDVVARLLRDAKPHLLVTDPPCGIELDSEWRDRAGLNGCGPAEPSYMKKRTEGHTETTISGDTWADWSEAFELVPSIQVAYAENSTIWDSPSPKFIMGGSDEQKFDHPTPKPVELMRKPIRSHTIPGEIVYEPFSGSGTTLMAAEQTERICYAVELDPKYVDVIVRRWQDYTGKQVVLDGDGRTFDEIAEERQRVAA
jgi:hypothetical protein